MAAAYGQNTSSRDPLILITLGVLPDSVHQDYHLFDDAVIICSVTHAFCLHQ